MFYVDSKLVEKVAKKFTWKKWKMYSFSILFFKFFDKYFLCIFASFVTPDLKKSK